MGDVKSWTTFASRVGAPTLICLSILYLLFNFLVGVAREDSGKIAHQLDEMNSELQNIGTLTNHITDVTRELKIISHEAQAQTEVTRMMLKRTEENGRKLDELNTSLSVHRAHADK